jgi:hypothetical protein
MDIEAYYRSLNTELFGLRDRVRFLLGGGHWPTDGGWKESVLRTALRRSLGAGIEVGQGFFVTDAAASPQLDVMLYRADTPVLFKDGNLVIVPASAALAIVEVKTRLTLQSMRDGVGHLIGALRMLPSRRNVMCGLFAYDTELGANQPVLEFLREACPDQRSVVDLVCNGPDRLVRFWSTPPGESHASYEKWHSYHLPETAFGYFIHNLISHVMPRGLPRSGQPFFPRPGKELHKDGEIHRAGAFRERLDNATALRREHAPHDR